MQQRRKSTGIGPQADTPITKHKTQNKSRSVFPQAFHGPLDLLFTLRIQRAGRLIQSEPIPSDLWLSRNVGSRQ